VNSSNESLCDVVNVDNEAQPTASPTDLIRLRLKGADQHIHEFCVEKVCLQYRLAAASDVMGVAA
jgi:hypothetical protein